MSEPTVLTERDGEVFVLRFNRPERLNALSVDMLEQCSAAVELAVSSGARALLMTGMGRSFNAGADLQAGSAVGGGDAGVILEKMINPLMQRLVGLPIPVLTAVNGAAAGVGAALALVGDFVLMGRSAYLLMAFVNIGLVPDGGLTYMLPRLVGRQRALHAMMLGERIPAETCESWGLIYRAVEDAALLEEAMTLARRLAAGPTRAYGLIRRNMRLGLDASLAEVLQLERDAQREASATADFREGVGAFLQRRKPVFSGR